MTAWLLSTTTAPHVTWRPDDYLFADPDPQYVSPEFVEYLRTVKVREHPDFVMPDLGYERRP